MKAWQGIGFWGLAGMLVGCGQHGPVQADVKVIRGEIIARAPAAPFIEEVSQPNTQPEVAAEIPKAPEVAKPGAALPGTVDGAVNVASDSTNPSNPEVPKKPLGEPGKIGDFWVIGFDRLASFKYEVPDDPISDPKAKAILDKNEIPDTISKYNKQKVAIKGYMLPLRVQDGKITELLVLRDQSMCCYGAVPKINEWVSVRMPEGKGVKPILDVPITIFGTLKVGEVLENGYLVGIYELDGERLEGPIDL